MNVTNLVIVELLSELKIAETLASKEKLSAQEERAYTTSLAKISLLKQGVTSSDIARAKTDELRRELGLRDVVIPDNAELRSAWHAFVNRGEVRTNYQSTSEYGVVNALTTNTQGGSFVPPDYDARLFASLPAVDEVLAPENCNIVETLTGSSMTTPAIDDVSGSPLVSAKSGRMGEAFQSTNGFVRSGSVKWGVCPTYRSGIVYVATELEQDSAFAMLGLLEQAFNRRHAYGFGEEVITGSGVQASGGTSGVPYGIVTAAPAVTNITAANANTAILPDLRTLFYTMPVQYRRGAKFYMSSTMAEVVAAQLETASRSKGDGLGLDTLFNRDVVICESMPASGNAVANAIIFAHPSYILVRKAKNSSRIQRFTQNAIAAEAGLVGFQSFFAADARPMLWDSVQPPVASLNTKA